MPVTKLQNSYLFSTDFRTKSWENFYRIEKSPKTLEKDGLFPLWIRHVQNVLSFNLIISSLMHWKPFCSVLSSMSIWKKFHLTENIPVSFNVTVKSVHITDLRHLITLFGYSPVLFLRGTGNK